jgi:hypothetical protein
MFLFFAGQKKTYDCEFVFRDATSLKLPKVHHCKELVYTYV